MTSNYQNNAGTDLDSIFLVTNSGGATTGFQVSDGTDLGKRYLTSTPLNQTVGFQNSAGTDIGYICGNYQNAGVNSYWATKGSNSVEGTYSWTEIESEDRGDSGVEYHEVTRYGRIFLGWFGVGMDTYGTNRIYQLAIAVLCGNNSKRTEGTLWLTDNSNAVHPDDTSGTVLSFGPLNKYSESSWLWIYNGPTDDHPARNFSIKIMARNNVLSTNVSYGLAVYQKVFNNYDPGWKRSEFWFN